MTFKTDKRNALEKLDKSKKGSVDEVILPLCDLINSLDDHYTTSSCSGRIVVLAHPESGKRHDADWIFVTHDIADTAAVKDALKDADGELWFLFEPLILHIANKDINSADKMLKLLRDLGFKRSGLISTSKFVIELIGTEVMQVPISIDGKQLVSGEYVDHLVNEANRKMVRNKENIDKIFNALLAFKS